MTDVTKPIVVPATAIPATSLALLRYVLAAIGGVFVTKGLLSEAELNEIIGLLLIVIPTIWGMIAARRNVKKQQEMEPFTPAEVAVRSDMVGG